MVNNHGDRKFPTDRVVPFPNGRTSWLINGGDQDFMKCQQRVFVAVAQSWNRQPKLPTTWRIIPFSKWLITMGSKFPNWGCFPSKWAKWLINRGY